MTQFRPLIVAVLFFALTGLGKPNPASAPFQQNPSLLKPPMAVNIPVSSIPALPQRPVGVPQLPQLRPNASQSGTSDPCNGAFYCLGQGSQEGLYWSYQSCGNSCGNEYWYVKGLPANVGTVTIAPRVTTGKQPTLITVKILKTAKLGQYPITIGATCSNNQCGAATGSVAVVVPPHLSYVNWYFDPRKVGFEVMDLPLHIEGLKDTTAPYQWTIQLGFLGRNDSAEIGLMPYGLLTTGEKYALAQFDGPGGAKAIAGTCRDESGYYLMCRLRYPWTVGHDYNLRVQVEHPITSREIWIGYVTDLTNHTPPQEIASWSVPAGWGLLNGSALFYAAFDGYLPSCDVQSYAMVLFNTPRLRTTPGSPPAVAKSMSSWLGDQCQKYTAIRYNAYGGYIATGLGTQGK